ncbi:hypothetical protein M501DRAFT_721740 [Patellaria atrata CBS 101060]|uniref:Uncharacterized protein n=1 Tax=Patellaria atrata CBS 101060 TaxID=1346257 RepID=A0A9P4SBY6_9PEZI|nr:hypothetical protein M501DRAFT_721740 [Patellaria atrata CBS 101060]
MAVCITKGNVTLHGEPPVNQLYVPIISTFCNGIQGAEGLGLVGTKVAVFENISKLQSVIANYNDANSIISVLHFVELPADGLEKNTIGAFVSFPPSWPGGKRLVPCAVDALWAPPTIQGHRSAIKVVTGSPGGWEDLGTCHLPNTKPITVSAEWANYLNPYIVDYNRTVFQDIIEHIPKSQNPRWHDTVTFVNPVIELILSIMITNGLASTASSVIPQGTLKGCTDTACTEMCYDGNGEWCKEIMPKHEFRDGGNIYNLPEDSDTTEMARFRVKIDINVYAYNSRGTAIRLSCAVLIVYCVG